MASSDVYTVDILLLVRDWHRPYNGLVSSLIVSSSNGG